MKRYRHPAIKDSDDISATLDSYAVLLRKGVETWHDLGQQAKEPRNDDAPISTDARSAAELGWPDGVAQAVGWTAATYVDAISQHALGLMDLFRSRQAIMPPWPIVRAQLELAGRVAWLLEGNPVTTEARVARYHMEALASWYRRCTSLGSMGAKKSVVKQFKRERDERHDKTKELFANATIEWSGPGSEETWRVGGEHYIGLRRSADVFGRSFLGGVKGIYDTLSDFSHPSPLSLNALSEKRTDGDHQSFDWTIDSARLSWLTRTSAYILFGSSRLISDYHGLDKRRLESWGTLIEVVAGPPMSGIGLRNMQGVEE